MRIIGMILVMIAAIVNMLPLAALAADDHAGMSVNMIECHCESMEKADEQDTDHVKNDSRAYMIDCSSSDKQTQQSQNHNRAAIFTTCQVSVPARSSCIYPDADHSAVGSSPSTETPPPRSLV